MHRRRPLQGGDDKTQTQTPSFCILRQTEGMEVALLPADYPVTANKVIQGGRGGRKEKSKYNSLILCSTTEGTELALHLAHYPAIEDGQFMAGGGGVETTSGSYRIESFDTSKIGSVIRPKRKRLDIRSERLNSSGEGTSVYCPVPPVGRQ